jgi:hypothetical protein
MAHLIFRNFDDIMYLGEHFRLADSLDNDDFIRRMGEIVKPSPPFKLCCNIECEPPFNAATRYFRELIDQYKLQALLDINSRLTGKKVSGSRLEMLFKDIKEELYLRREHAEVAKNSLALRGYVLGSGRLTDDADSAMATKYCIFHYIHVAVVEILCEMHIHFRDLVMDIVWTGNCAQLSKVVLPDCQYMDGVHVAEEAATECAKAHPVADYAETGEPGAFAPVLGDSGEPARGVIPYDYMIRNPKRFGWVEGLLFREGIIDSNNRFIWRHGHKKLMAAISHSLIEKNYFNPIDDSKGRRIKPYHVRKFLEHRYQVSFKKQFETSAKDVNERIALIESFEWLSSLPFCENSLN